MKHVLGGQVVGAPLLSTEGADSQVRALTHQAPGGQPLTIPDRQRGPGPGVGGGRTEAKVCCSERWC